MNEKYCSHERLKNCMTDDMVTNMMHDVILLSNCMTCDG